MSSLAPNRQLSLFELTALVVGSMIGSGIFALPAAFGRTTGVYGALLAWLIAGSGMLCLALVFQSLSRRKPALDTGIYAYAKAGFGDYAGVLSALGYWIGCCLADVASPDPDQGHAGAVHPDVRRRLDPGRDRLGLAAAVGVPLLILRGIKQAALLNTIATVAKLVPIAVFLFVVAAGFQRDVFAWNGWGGEPASSATLCVAGAWHVVDYGIRVRRHRRGERGIRALPVTVATSAWPPCSASSACSACWCWSRCCPTASCCGRTWRRIAKPVDGGGHGSGGRAVGQGVRQRRPVDLGARQLLVLVLRSPPRSCIRPPSTTPCRARARARTPPACRSPRCG